MSEHSPAEPNRNQQRASSQSHDRDKDRDQERDHERALASRNPPASGEAARGAASPDGIVLAQASQSLAASSSTATTAASAAAAATSAASAARSRRNFLQAGGAVVVSFAIGAYLPKWAFAQETGTQGRPAANTLASTNAAAIGKPLDPHQVDSFLAFHADSSVTIYTSKVDVGTGLRIAMAQMTAEELGIPVERISIIEGDTALVPDHGGTGGSSGIPRGAVEVRQAAATARQAILSLAATRLNRPAADLIISGGIVRPASGGAPNSLAGGVSIGALIGEKRLNIQVDAKAPLRDPATYAIVGKPLLRPDIPAKCTGKRTYIQDHAVAGMLHARVIRPPAIGAKLDTVDESSVSAIPGARVVRIQSFLAVAAPDEWAAVRAARELKATWTPGLELPGSEGLDQYVRQSPVDHDETIATKGGDPSTALASAARKLTATYTWPCQSHASLGPSCAVADVRENYRQDGATVWTSSQGSYGQRAQLAKLFAMPEEKLRVIFLDGAGSYGGNGNDDVAADAFLLSRELKKPVRVQWMREDEHGWDPKGPPQVLEVRGGLDAQGKIVAWDTQMWIPATLPGTRPLLAADAAGLAQPHGQGSGAISQNGDPPYAAENVRVVAHWLKSTPLRPSNLRAPGKIANVFAVEGFADEMAAELGIDAVEFRLTRLDDPRAIAVIKRAAEMFGWQTRPAPAPRPAQGGLLVGRGFAYMRYKQAENYVAMAMEVAVEPATGKIAVRRVTCAHDCGLIVNPDGLRNQIEGSIAQTLSRTLHEEVKFDSTHVTSVNWASYPILTFPEVPPIQVALIDHPELPPLGAGEAAAAPVAAALANAVFDATGARLRSVPFTPARVKGAMVS